MSFWRSRSLIGILCREQVAVKSGRLILSKSNIACDCEEVWGEGLELSGGGLRAILKY